MNSIATDLVIYAESFFLVLIVVLMMMMMMMMMYDANNVSISAAS